jgi:1-acyl-sn-glycerol-3-phosphate acyltransferase
MSKKRHRPVGGDTLRPRSHRPRHARKAKGEPVPNVDPTALEAEPPTVPLLDAETGTSPESAPDIDVAEQIRALEERLDRMIGEVAKRGPDLEKIPRSARGHRSVAPSGGPDGDGDATVFDTAREFLSSDFYMRKWGRLGMRNRSEEVDDFGFDPVYEERVMPIFNFLYDRYFRVECQGVGNIPPEGRCLIVGNHSGTIPYDGAMLKVAVKKEHPKPRDVRWLAEDFIFHFPFLGSFSNRIGAVRACQENAERLLRQEALVAVFPEGIKGIGKLFKDRYKLQRFGRGGFIKLCLRTNTPVVPVAVVGAEETHPMLLRVHSLADMLGLPYIPVTPTFPWLGPLGLLPAPTKWKIVFGEPQSFEGYGPEAADDEILVGQLAEQVRGTIQAMVDRTVGERHSVWFG